MSLRQSEGQIDCDSVVFPLNALIDDQINLTRLESVVLVCAGGRFEESFQENLQTGDFQLGFIHP